MSVKIITDSTADMPDSGKSRILTVPMHVRFGSEEYLDGVTLSRQDFYEKLAQSKELPATSQPSPAAFMQAYADAADAGDEVLVITIAQALSGTFQCANLAAAEAECPVAVVDSETATQGECILVREALRLREQGFTAAEIAAQLDVFKKRVRVIAVVDSLKHLQKGGRVSAAVALVGGALGIKPVLSLYDSRIRLEDKGRGRPGALVAMYKLLEKMGGIDPDYGYTLLYTDDRQLAAPVHHYMHNNLHLTGGRVGQVGATIGTHIGPRAVGLAFVLAKE